MSDLNSWPTVVRFGAFEVSFDLRELRKHGMRIQLEEKPFQILEMLIQNAGQVVKRKALCEKLWPSTYVAFDHSLNTAVNKLRGVLGDVAQSPRFIETRPRLGYRFVAPVERVNGDRPQIGVGRGNVSIEPHGRWSRTARSSSGHGRVGSRFQPSTTSSGIAPASEGRSNCAVTDFFSPGSNEK